MSFIKRIFSQISGAAVDAPVGEIAQDSSRSIAERGEDIANAVNSYGSTRPYLDYFNKQMGKFDQYTEGVKLLQESAMRLWQEGIEYSKKVREVAQAGEDALTTNRHLLEVTEQSLKMQRQKLLVTVKEIEQETDQLVDTFSVLAAAGDKIHKLSDAEKKDAKAALDIIQKQATNTLQSQAGLPPENKDLENAFAKIRNDENERAAQAREASEAAAAAEAATHKVRLNEYLNTGLSTSSAVKAPGTARFTRKPKGITQQ